MRGLRHKVHARSFAAQVAHHEWTRLGTQNAARGGARGDSSSGSGSSTAAEAAAAAEAAEGAAPAGGAAQQQGCSMPIGPIGRRELAETPFNFDRFFAWTGYFSPQNSSPAARLLGASGRGCRPNPPKGDPPIP